MNDNMISISVTGEEREFIVGEIASGKFGDAAEVLHAGLALLERESKLRELRRLIAEGEADIEDGRTHSFEDADEMAKFVIERAKSRK